MRAHTGMHGEPGLSHSARPMLLFAPRASCDKTRQMRSVCGTDAWRGHKTTRGRSGSTIKVESRHPKVVSRATCAVGVPGALGRGGMAACKACAGQLRSCVHMVQRMTFRAHNVLRVQNKTTPAMSVGRCGERR